VPDLDRVIQFLKDGDYRAAHDELVALDAARPGDFVVLGHLALCKEELGDLVGAAAVCDQALAIVPDDADLRARRARCA
jgi:hypothetical protein